jgi:hypothetical protein
METSEAKLPNDRCAACGHRRELHRPECHYLAPHHQGGSCDPKRCVAFVETEADDAG